MLAITVDMDGIGIAIHALRKNGVEPFLVMLSTIFVETTMTPFQVLDVLSNTEQELDLPRLFGNATVTSF